MLGLVLLNLVLRLVMERGRKLDSVGRVVLKSSVISTLLVHDVLIAFRSQLAVVADT